MIIDVHCHAGRGDGLTGPWDTAAPLTAYLHRARAAGIDRTVVFAAFGSDYASANRAVARHVAALPDRLFGFAFVHPERDRGRVAALVEEAVEVHGFVGVKVHRHDAPLSREVCEAARRFRVPVMYDVMGEVAIAELLAREYPDVAFVIPHLGSFADDWRAQLALIDHLVRHPNVFADTSGVRRFGLLEQAVRRAGPQKILFGSDGPWLHPGVELAKIDALELGPAARRAVLGGNFQRLIARVRRAGPRVHTPARAVPQGGHPPEDRFATALAAAPSQAPEAAGAQRTPDPWLGAAGPAEAVRLSALAAGATGLVLPRVRAGATAARGR